MLILSQLSMFKRFWSKNIILSNIEVENLIALVGHIPELIIRCGPHKILGGNIQFSLNFIHGRPKSDHIALLKLWYNAAHFCRKKLAKLKKKKVLPVAEHWFILRIFV